MLTTYSLAKMKEDSKWMNFKKKKKFFIYYYEYLSRNFLKAARSAYGLPVFGSTYLAGLLVITQFEREGRAKI